jgi:sterol desaturase/sphingolipid hydroxylase (fatty acid hydroxylase superfamily)
MRSSTRKDYESIRIFENPILERFTHVHPLTPLVFWGPVMVALLYRAMAVHEFGVGAVVALFAAGLFVWTLVEYLLHRFVFHFLPEGRFQERIQFLIHGLHHADPVDPTRLVMPPAASIILAVILFSTFRALLGAAPVEPFFAGFLLGYLCYDYIHFCVHFYQPRTRVGRALKQNHMIHHFVSHNSRWGVSSPLWDYVFGTLSEPKRVRHGS